MGREARSRLTSEEGREGSAVREERLVRRRVSGARRTVKDVSDGDERVVTVRQVPLMEMESPGEVVERREEEGEGEGSWGVICRRVEVGSVGDGEMDVTAERERERGKLVRLVTDGEDLGVGKGGKEGAYTS